MITIDADAFYAVFKAQLGDDADDEQVTELAEQAIYAVIKRRLDQEHKQRQHTKQAPIGFAYSVRGTDTPE